MWTDVDNRRTGGLPFVFQPGFGFEQYVEYAMDVPMYFVYRCEGGVGGRVGAGCQASLRPWISAGVTMATACVWRKRRDGKYVNALGQSWRDFMAGKLPALPGQCERVARAAPPHGPQGALTVWRVHSCRAAGLVQASTPRWRTGPTT